MDLHTFPHSLLNVILWRPFGKEHSYRKHSGLYSHNRWLFLKQILIVEVLNSHGC